MEITPQRRLTIADALILVAAAGCGFAFAREWLGRDRQFNDNSFPGYQTFMITACWAAFTISIALIPLRLRQPHPRWQVLRWQPGLVACFAVLLSLILGTFTYLQLIVAHSNGLTIWMQMVVSPSHVAPMIIAMWSLLAIGKRWRSEASWIDRAGRMRRPSACPSPSVVL